MSNEAETTVILKDYSLIAERERSGFGFGIKA